MRKYTIAILECDTPVDAVLNKLGTYGDIFEAFLRHGLEKYLGASGGEEVELNVIKSNMVDLGPLPQAGDVDSVILTGSSKLRTNPTPVSFPFPLPADKGWLQLLTHDLEHNAFEDHPWMIRLVDYVRDLYQTTQKPIVGICFGHQIIARALDAPVQRNNIGWEISVDQINLTAEGQQLFGVDKLVQEAPYLSETILKITGCHGLASKWHDS